MNLQKQTKKAVLKALKKKSTTSTLEVKTYLRNKFPNAIITQDHVSAMMDFIARNKKIKNLTFKDAGTHREYRMEKPTPTTKPVNSKNYTACDTKALIDVLNNTKGRFCGITVEIKGVTQVFNCKVKGMKDKKSVTIHTNKGVTGTLRIKDITLITLGRHVYVRD